MDDPLEIVNSAIDQHAKMIKQMKGVPGNFYVIFCWFGWIYRKFEFGPKYASMCEKKILLCVIWIWYHVLQSKWLITHCESNYPTIMDSFKM